MPTNNRNTVKVDYSVDLQPRGECENCDWRTGPSLTTENRATNHVRSRGHRVKVITESLIVYEPEKPSRARKKPL